MLQRHAATEVHGKSCELEFRFKKRRRALRTARKLQGKQCQHVSNSGLQFGDQTLRAAAEEGIKNHGRNTDSQSGRGIEKSFTNAVRKLHVTLTTEVRAQRSKR